MKPALTTSGKTRTATAFDLHLAAAGFCATTCCSAAADWLVKSSADAVRVLSNATLTSIKPGTYFHFHVIFIYIFYSMKRYPTSEWSWIGLIMARRGRSAYRTLGLYGLESLFALRSL